MTAGPVKIVECPRDAWQGLPRAIPAEIKARYLAALIAAGFTHIDAVSFVSPHAIPQMADSEEVLALLRPPGNVEIIGIVVNPRGVERALRTGAVRTAGFPYSVSQEFLRRNQNQSAQEALTALDQIAAVVRGEKLNLIAYLSMAFGNPYGEPWEIDSTITACHVLAGMGVGQISLADTVGVATAEQVFSLVSATTAAFAAPGGEAIEIGVHLHSAPGQAAQKIVAAYDAGCRRFDMALGGLGGCPFAQNTLVGNVATDEALSALHRRGAILPRLHLLDELLTMSQSIAGEFGGKHEPFKGNGHHGEELRRH
jgi:hydroxymethylglutaryl-CoA lyase